MLLADVEQAMRDFITGSPLNTVQELASLKIYDTPLCGVAAANDLLFAELKEPWVVGPHHMSPDEWMRGAQAVITYFLPYTSRVRVANRTPGLPAEEWLYGRVEGETLNNALREFLIKWLNKAGCQAMAPVLDSRFTVVNRRSNWSERHVAFIAGLGTFSLSASLITKLGAAGRLGSVIVNLDLAPTPRPYTQIDEYCTKCGACMRRCPAEAIHKLGKEHGPCSDYLEETHARFQPRYGCGKCQTGVPCETSIP